MTSKLSLELATREEALVWTETVVFAFTNVVAVFGNLLTFYAVYRKPRLRTIPNMFVRGGLGRTWKSENVFSQSSYKSSNFSFLFLWNCFLL